MQVSLFMTCVSDVMFPNVGKAVVHLLRKQGCEVDFPLDQTCCGQPAFNSGYKEEAKKSAQQLIRAFEDAEYVITPSGSCASMIRHYYPNLFTTDDEWREKAQAFIDKTYEFSEFMVEVLQGAHLPASYEGVATYHHSCHMLRGLGVADAPLQLLKNVQGLDVKDLPYAHDCCGFGGTFSVKMKEISQNMVDEKVEHIQRTGAHILVGSDMACLMQIEGRLRRSNHPIQVFHVAELLYEGVKRYESTTRSTI